VSNNTLTNNRTPEEILIREIIAKIAVGPNRGKDITKQEAYRATANLLDGKLDETQAALFLIGLRMKKESMMEYAGILKGLNESSVIVETDLPKLVYLADPFDGYSRNMPVSPYIPAVLAACDIPCLIQGVEKVGPKYGVTAHQVYANNGLKTDLAPESVASKLTDLDCGWGYIDQAQSNPKLYALNAFRDKIVKRTALTTLERVLMPIRAQENELAIGYVHRAYPEIYAAMASLINFDKAIIIKGLEGGICPDLKKPLRSFIWTEGKLSEKSVELTPSELLNLRINSETKLSVTKSHLRNIEKQPFTNKFQELVATSAFIVAKHKGIPLSRAAVLTQHAIESGEAARRFSNFK